MTKKNNNNDNLSFTSVVLDQIPFTKLLCSLPHDLRTRGHLNRGERTLAGLIRSDVDETVAAESVTLLAPSLVTDTRECSLNKKRADAHQQQVGDTEDQQGDAQHHDCGKSDKYASSLCKFVAVIYMRSTNEFLHRKQIVEM